MLRSKPLWPTYHVTSVSSEHYDYDIKIKKTVLNWNNLRAGDENGRGLGGGEKGRGIGREGKGRLQKEPSFFISADAGVCKFLIGLAVMSNLLKCIS